jgi:hypothetical protein
VSFLVDEVVVCLDEFKDERVCVSRIVVIAREREVHLRLSFCSRSVPPKTLTRELAINIAKRNSGRMCGCYAGTVRAARLALKGMGVKVNTYQQ